MKFFLHYLVQAHIFGFATVQSTLIDILPFVSSLMQS
jgi:hypothetical protein